MSGEIDYRQLAAQVISQTSQTTGTPAVDKNYSQEAVQGVLGVLKDAGYDEDSLRAARIQMTGAKNLVEKTIDDRLSNERTQFVAALRDRDADSTLTKALKEHYSDAEYGAKLKKIDGALKHEVYKKIGADPVLMQRWNNGDPCITELDNFADEVVDDHLKEMFGYDRKANNPSIKPKPTSSEGAVAGENAPKGAPPSVHSGDFNQEFDKLTPDQRAAFEARYTRLHQRQGKSKEEARKGALEYAKEVPAYFPQRGLNANMVRF